MYCIRFECLINLSFVKKIGPSIYLSVTYPLIDLCLFLYVFMYLYI
jgi:hypothetical protein